MKRSTLTGVAIVVGLSLSNQAFATDGVTPTATGEPKETVSISLDQAEKPYGVVQHVDQIAAVFAAKESGIELLPPDDDPFGNNQLTQTVVENTNTYTIILGSPRRE
jgi:hypothetical protein